MADAFSFELLRGRALLIDVIARAVAEGGVNLIHTAGIDHFNLAPVGAVQVNVRSKRDRLAGGTAV